MWRKKAYEVETKQGHLHDVESTCEFATTQWHLHVETAHVVETTQWHLYVEITSEVGK